MADAVEMIGRLLTIVEDRERYRDELEFEKGTTNALSNEVLELRNERDAMKAERDRAIEERDLARSGFDLRREREEAITRAELAVRQRAEAMHERDELLRALDRERCAHHATRVERDNLAQVRDVVRSLVGVGSAEMSDEPTTVKAVRAVVKELNLLKDIQRTETEPATNELRTERDVLRVQLDALRTHQGPPLNEQANAEAGKSFNPMPTPGALWSGRGVYYDMIEVLDNGPERVIISIEWVDGCAASTIGRSDALTLAAAVRRKFGVVEPIHGFSHERLLARAEDAFTPEDAVALVQDLLRGDV